MKVRVNGVTYDSCQVLIMVKLDADEKNLIGEMALDNTVFASFPDNSIYDISMVEKMLDEFKLEED